MQRALSRKELFWHIIQKFTFVLTQLVDIALKMSLKHFRMIAKKKEKKNQTNMKICMRK